MSRHHPKWREIDVHAPIEGWTRFEAASRWIKSAARDLRKPTRVAGSELPMQGNTTSPVQLSAGSGEVEPSIAEPAVNHPKSVFTASNNDPPLSPGITSLQDAGESQAADRASFDEKQRDALFREFVAYQNREAQRAGGNPSQKEALFAEFQTYVAHLLQQPDPQPRGVNANPPVVQFPGNPLGEVRQ